MSSKMKPTMPDAAVIENDNRTSVDVIDSTSKNKFLWQWLKDADDNGDFLSKYIRKLKKDGVAWCTFCDCELKYGNRGKQAFIAHSKTKGHLKKRQLSLLTQPLPNAFQCLKDKVSGGEPSKTNR